MVTLYHGTNSENARCIMDEGFRGSELSGMTDGFTNLDEGGVVFLTDSIEEAKGYGDTVIAVTMYNESPIYFQDAPHSNAKEYYVTVEQIHSDAAVNIHED